MMCSSAQPVTVIQSRQPPSAIYRACAAPPTQSSGPVINKVPVAMMMSSNLYTYLLDHTRESKVLALLREETSRMQGYRMQITPEQGCLLGLLVELTGARRAIEVGVFTGYSSISIAQALLDDGYLLALDVDQRTMTVARKYWELAGVAHKVEGVVGPAAMSLQDALQREGPNSYDFAFIDADKQGYDTYYEILLRLVRPGGLIVIDNVLWYGRVADPEETDKATMALKALNHKLLHDPRISLSIVPVGDGVALCRRR
ncbi:O-methyltransferase-domain-containing protein [Haematococcus lacustris]